MVRTDSNHTPPNQKGGLDQLAQAAGQAHDRLRANAAKVETLEGQPPGPGDLWVLAAGPGDLDDDLEDDLGDAVEWAVLEIDDCGDLYLVPADASPLLGTADVAAPECRVLRCGLGAWFASNVLDGARRTGVLDAGTLAAARKRRRVLEEGGSHGSLEALETDRDPEYLQLLRGMQRAKGALKQRHGAARAQAPRGPEHPEVSRRRPRHRPRRWAIPVTLAASLLLSVIAIQWQTITELRRGATPIVDAPVVWLVPEGDRGPPEMQTFPEETPYVVLVLHPEFEGSPPEAYRLEIFSGEEAERALWSDHLSPGELPELFVLVPGRFLKAGDYRLKLTGQREGEEIPAGRFRLRVAGGPSGS